MKFAKLAAAVSAAAVASAAFAVAASAATTTVSNSDTGRTTVTIDFADMADAYSKYLDDSGKLKQEEPYTTTFGELPGYYGFYPNLATGNDKDYIVNDKLVIGNYKTSSTSSINANKESLSEGRYLKFVPEHDCDLTVGGSVANNGGWNVGSMSGTGVISTTIECKQGEVYYIYSKTRSRALTITSLSYTYDTSVIPSAEVTSFEKLNEETLKDENGGQADAYTFTVTGNDGEFTAKSVSFKIGEITQTKNVSLTLDKGSTAVYGLIVNSKDSSEALPKVTQDMITIE